MKRSFILGSLMCIALVGSGCTPFNRVGLPAQSDPTVSTLPAAPRSSQELPAPATEGAKQQPRPVSSQSTSNIEWVLQPGLFGVNHGMWLSWISLTFGLCGIGLALLIRHQSVRAINQLNLRLSRITKDLERVDLSMVRISNKSEQDASSLASFRASCQKLEDKYADILTSIKNIRIQQMIEPETNAVQMQNLTSPPPVTSKPLQLTPSEKQAVLTAAVNRGDRQLVKSETRAQLNITHASENAISMGRLNETQLEEVSAGGSYWATSFDGETWLYPTEQTLKGYTQFQRPTGIFNYTRQPIAFAQVVSPARLTLSGSIWQVTEPGTIAVPG